MLTFVFAFCMGGGLVAAGATRGGYGRAYLSGGVLGVFIASLNAIVGVWGLAAILVGAAWLFWRGSADFALGITVLTLFLYGAGIIIGVDGWPHLPFARPENSAADLITTIAGGWGLVAILVGAAWLCGRGSAARALGVAVLTLVVGVIAAVYAGPILPFSTPKTSAGHVIAAIEYHNKAATISNKLVGWTVPNSDWDAIIDYDRKALVEAEKADIADMNRWYPGFGDHFRDEFITGLRLIIENDRGIASIPPSLRGQVLDDNFGEWYHAHYDAIRAKR